MSQKRHIFGYHLGTVWETKSLKTGFQNSIKKSAENKHHFYEILGSFWGPFLSKKSVVCRSKMSLTYGPLKNVILGPSGHPKSTKLEVILWCKFDRFGRWLGRAVHKHQCSFSSVVHVILAAEQSKAEQSRVQQTEHSRAQQSTAQQIRIQHITRTA